jgi:DNA-binding NtrC family response regulator
MLTLPSVLLFSSDSLEAQNWQEILREHATVRTVRDFGELQQGLQNDCYDALFCAWKSPSGTWRQVLEHVRQWNTDIPVVVFSGTADEREWVRVLEAGAFDLLASPLQRRTVLPVLEQAVTSYEARRFYHTGSYVRARAS